MGVRFGSPENCIICLFIPSLDYQEAELYELRIWGL